MSKHLTPSPEVLDALNNAFIEPARNLTKSRGKNIHRYASVKMNHRVSVETALECDACYHFDFASSIRKFCSQPIRYSFAIDDKTHTYVPDFLVEFTTGEFILYEVKRDKEANSNQFKREFNAKAAAAEQLGVYLELIKESHIRVTPLLQNLKLIHRYASRKNLSETQKTLLSILCNYGPQRVESLMFRTGLPKQRIMPIICDLLSRCILETDLYTPLTIETEVRLVYV
ncbi:Tn7 transposase TnsA N-terminal domain-containing protein [Photobacterium sp. SDRW27]|uniref:Tn7 transposase TnsA N-terminal domain-containing protein n=1 Tax=Photobacterium obscurum TaxID=2829490 RepID=UPI00224303CB|nr:Tn7 transposase TnsA N-terminal domain-containing protein [Photobacterium obscurum]MCW8330273.1 Tn7 transposase TnsA N-terminal domain-containing protein [Photobacterium obscurum]